MTDSNGGDRDLRHLLLRKLQSGDTKHESGKFTTRQINVGEEK